MNEELEIVMICKFKEMILQCIKLDFKQSSHLKIDIQIETVESIIKAALRMAGVKKELIKVTEEFKKGGGISQGLDAYFMECAKLLIRFHLPLFNDGSFVALPLGEDLTVVTINHELKQGIVKDNPSNCQIAGEIASILQKEFQMSVTADQVLNQLQSKANSISDEKYAIDRDHTDYVNTRTQEKDNDLSKKISVIEQKESQISKEGLPAKKWKRYDERRLYMKMQAFQGGGVTLEEARVFLEREQLHIADRRSEIYRIDLKIQMRAKQFRKKFGTSNTKKFSTKYEKLFQRKSFLQEELSSNYLELVELFETKIPKLLFFNDSQRGDVGNARNEGDCRPGRPVEVVGEGCSSKAEQAADHDSCHHHPG
jgi:hypothetical protein